MVMRMEDIYTPAPAKYREAEVGFNIGGPGGKPFQGSPQEAMNVMAFVNRMQEAGEAPQEEEAPAQDVSLIDPEKFRTMVHKQIGGDPRKFNVMNEARRLFASRITGLRNHVFGGGARHLSAEQQSFFADRAAQLWRMCVAETGNERKRLQDDETFAMDELDRRRETHNLKVKQAKEERKRGVDLTKTFTPESVKRYQRTGDVSALKKPKEAISIKDRLEARTQINEETADRMANLEQDEDGNTLLNGKVATPAQLKTYERAIREQISRDIYGPDLADVTGGRQGKTDYASIFGEKKDTKDTGGQKKGGKNTIYEQKTEDGGKIWVDQKGTVYDKDPRVDVKKKTPGPAANKEIKNQAKTIKAAAEKKNMTVGDAIGALADEIKHESGVEKARKFTNSLSKKYGNTQQANKEFIKDMKAAAKEAGIAASFFNDWLKSMWFGLDAGTKWTMDKVLDLPVPGTEKS